MLDTPRSYRFPITGLTCAGCVRRAENALNAVPGVRAAEVNLATSTAQVTTDTASPPQLAQALSQAGYPAAKHTSRLRIDGMHCGSCIGRVEAALASVPGVTRAAANLASGLAEVESIAGMVTHDDLLAALQAAGYDAETADDPSAEPEEDRAEREIHGLRRDTVIAALLTAPIFVIEMGGHAVPAFHHWVLQTIGQQTSWVLQFALASVVLAGPGRRFFAAGLPALRRGAPDMNALVAIGTAAAWGFSTIATFAPGLLPDGSRQVYFEAAAVIVTLVLAGRWMESRAKGRAGAAVKALLGLQPDTARIDTPEGPRDIPAARLKPGDRLHVRPGERVAADGVVLDGTSHVDEAMLTGEPLPVAKAAGDPVAAGTVNGAGFLLIDATEVGRNTQLSRIARMVEDAQAARLPVQALVNRVTMVFVPVVIAVSVLTLLLWLAFGPDPALNHALVAAVAVLIVACPCAMGLATPTSIMVGTGRAAELGVLFRQGAALQRLREVRVVAFDKTGTLTEGRPKVTDIVTADGMDATDVLAAAASLEAQSEHPIAAAIVAAAADRDLAAELARNVAVVPGKGITGIVGGRRIAIGNAALLADGGVDPGTLADNAAREAGNGRTALYVAIDDGVAAVIVVSDPVKREARDAIAALRAMGIRVAMITGDAEATAQSVARSLGIDDVRAGILPDGKRAAVDALRRYGPVAFVGDGINDAPALAAADTGLAIGTGTDIAIEAADVVLMSGDPRGVVTALNVSRRVMTNIRQNLFWAFAYNAALIPVAAGALYPLTGTLLSPALAAGAMALSSVFVVSNALRLRRIGVAT